MKREIKTLLLSETLVEASATRRIAYIAIMSALCVICNMFFEIDVSADMKISLTVFFSAFTGIIIGPLFGFVAAFMGDLVGYLYASSPFAYSPWIGITVGVVALIAGLIMNAPILKFKGAPYVKLLLVCVLTFLIGTVAINTTAFWIKYNMRKTPYFTYLTTRLFVQGQIFNNLLNYALLFIAYPVFDRLKRLINRTN